MQNQRSNFVNDLNQAGKVGLAQKIKKSLHSMEKIIHLISLRSHQIYGGVSLYWAGVMLTQINKTKLLTVGYMHLTLQGNFSYTVIQVLLLLQLKKCQKVFFIYLLCELETMGIYLDHHIHVQVILGLGL